VRRTLTGEIPLVSRDAEMDWILAHLRRPDPAAFVLAGAAGVGKTRLAAEAAKSAAALGFTTAQAAGSQHEPEPLPPALRPSCDVLRCTHSQTCRQAPWWPSP